ncbi:MAG: SdpI family protein [Clostridiales bacterium]|nr:SdpI family protein [Clostridiales bacterium]
MGFWIYMLLFVLLIPITMVYFGQRFFKSPPKSINATFGYRTTMSMKNWETWKLAHTVCGRFWFRCGRILLPLSVVPMLLVIGRGTETVGYTGVIIVFIQLVPLLCVIPVTEHALRKKFDKNGMRKS